MIDLNNNRTYGRLDAFWETGTEGVQWSFKDASLPGYDGLMMIDDAELTILAYDKQTPLWTGKVDLEYQRRYRKFPQNPSHGQQEIFNHWVHGFEKTLNPELWATFFFEKRRAILHKTDDHPFNGDSAGMRSRLEKLPEKQQAALFESTAYGWLAFDSDNAHRSLADEWGFTLDEVKQLLGGITDEQITKLKTWPKSSGDMTFDFSMDLFERTALLFGVYGGIDWLFDSVEERKQWLARDSKDGEPIKKLLLEGGLPGIIRMRDYLLNACFVKHK